ncbi:MAG TPA: class I adenylate-forming enzyme family protein [Candidatus Deferrimicrobium sp.]|nr:class I adenylate-forming enzyme family protein [Candidatus Deferrimicrobium sp.]
MAIENIGLYVHQVAKKHPKQKAIIQGDRALTYKELDNRINSLANLLVVSLGIKKGDHIAVLLFNCPEYLEIYSACYRIGAAVVGINYRYQPPEILYIIEDSKPRILITSEEFVDAIKEIKNEKGFKSVEHLFCIGLVPPEGFSNYDNELLKHFSTEVRAIELTEDDKAFLIYTGGTTGTPKGAVWTHKAVNNLIGLGGMLNWTINMFARVKQMPKKLKSKVMKMLPLPWSLGRFPVFSLLHTDARQEKIVNELMEGARANYPEGSIADRGVSKNIFLWPPPLFHIYGWLSHLIIFSGGTLVLTQSRSYNPAEVFELIKKHKVTFLMTIGDKTARALLDSPELEKYKKVVNDNIVGIVSGAAIFSAATKRKLWEAFPDIGFLDTVAATESLQLVPKVYIPGDKVSSNEFDKLPDDQMRIVNEKGEDVKPGEMGEGYFKAGPTMKEYLGAKEKTSDTIIDGWVHSGDLYKLNEDGKSVILIGRIKETINTGGEKIHPPEVEDVLEKHPKVSESVVIGIPDPQWGQSALALIKLKPQYQNEKTDATREELTNFVKENLARYKAPKYIEFVDEFPVSPAGKVLRAKLRREFEKFVSEE